MVEYENCPVCGKEIIEGLKPNFCPFCGVKLYPKVEGAPAIIEEKVQTEGEKRAPAGTPEAMDKPREREGIPWENQPDLGILQRLSRTWTESLFNAKEFFRNMPLGGRISPAFLYGFIFIAIGNLFSIFWQTQKLGFIDSTPEQMSEGYPEVLRNWLVFLTELSPQDQLLLIPVYAVAGMFLSTIFYHGVLLMVGGATNGFATTFRVVAYTSGAMAFTVAPFIGEFIAVVFGFVLTVVGLREGHESTTGKALAAVLSPFLLVCCLAFFLAVSFMGGV